MCDTDCNKGTFTQFCPSATPALHPFASGLEFNLQESGQWISPFPKKDTLLDSASQIVRFHVGHCCHVKALNLYSISENRCSERQVNDGLRQPRVLKKAPLVPNDWNVSFEGWPFVSQKSQLIHQSNVSVHAQIRRWNSWRTTNILVHQLKTSHKKGLAKYQIICTEYKCLRREYQAHLKVLKCAATV